MMVLWEKRMIKKVVFYPSFILFILEIFMFFFILNAQSTAVEAVSERVLEIDPEVVEDLESQGYADAIIFINISFPPETQHILEQEHFLPNRGCQWM